MNDRDERQFEDELVEAALRERANAQPRTGLEERILRSVEAQRSPRLVRLPRWAWAFAAGAAAVVLAATLILHRPAVSGPSAPTVSITETPKPVKPGPSRNVIARVPPPAANSKTVRLAVFPSPRPLSAQEKLLLAYVRKSRLAESAAVSAQPLDEELKIPKLEVAALDIKPIEDSEKTPEK